MWRLISSAPCALGATANDKTISRLRARVIAGGANNQLAGEKKLGHMLREKGIIFAPDYAINAGGLMGVANEHESYSRERAMKQAEGISDNILRIFEIAGREEIPTFEASSRLAEEWIASFSHIRNLHGQFGIYWPARRF